MKLYSYCVGCIYFYGTLTFQMFSHFWYDAPASRLATYYARDVPVYLYSFDHISENLDYDSKSSTLYCFPYNLESFFKLQKVVANIFLLC